MPDAGTAPDAGPGIDAGVPSAGGTDAGSPSGGGNDAGSPSGGGADAGSPPGGGADAGSPSGGGQDGGPQANDCDGLLRGDPGAPAQFVWPDRDLNGSSGGFCAAAETDGTGHLALQWQNDFQPHNSKYGFVDPATNSQVGSYDHGVRLALIGQASGFMGVNCSGQICAETYAIVDPSGQPVYESSFIGDGNGRQANDPTGGMVIARIVSPSGGFGQTGSYVIDAIDPSGAVRWTRPLPDMLGTGNSAYDDLRIGVDRRGNVLALWSSDARYGKGTWAGEWFDHDGSPGPVFDVFRSENIFVGELYERVGDGLFLSGFVPGVVSIWLGQFEARAARMTAAPQWLASRPDRTLHMIHGGTGYAMLPVSGQPSATCEQRVEVISASGQACGTATFPIGGGACTTQSIVVGYEGTVVQQEPRERESCRANDHLCTCTYRYWPGFFR